MKPYISTGRLPPNESVAMLVAEAHRRFRDVVEGENSQVYPALAQARRDLFGVCVASTRGETYTAGDAEHEFSIMSVSKPFLFALVCDVIGVDAARDRLGVNSTGLPFDSLCAIERSIDGRTNPMVNAGAIATTSLISGADAAAKWSKILEFYSKAAGEKLSRIEEVYKSEAATNQGNRALAALLVKYERIYSDPLEAVDIYTKGCSVGANTKQLAQMGAMLANNGRNPVTGEQVIREEDIAHILSAMTMAGLYDGSGSWAWHVGLPAKSGVGGAILAIAPGKGAIAVFAPRLDEAGNSVKAQKVIAYVADKLDYNLFSPRSVGLK